MTSHMTNHLKAEPWDTTFTLKVSGVNFLSFIFFTVFKDHLPPCLAPLPGPITVSLHAETLTSLRAMVAVAPAAGEAVAVALGCGCGERDGEGEGGMMERVGAFWLVGAVAFWNTICCSVRLRFGCMRRCVWLKISTATHFITPATRSSYSGTVYILDVCGRTGSDDTPEAQVSDLVCEQLRGAFRVLRVCGGKLALAAGRGRNCSSRPSGASGSGPRRSESQRGRSNRRRDAPSHLRRGEAEGQVRICGCFSGFHSKLIHNSMDSKIDAAHCVSLSQNNSLHKMMCS